MLLARDMSREGELSQRAIAVALQRDCRSCLDAIAATHVAREARRAGGREVGAHPHVAHGSSRSNSSSVALAHVLIPDVADVLAVAILVAAPAGQRFPGRSWKMATYHGLRLSRAGLDSSHASETGARHANEARTPPRPRIRGRHRR
jgi:hypothetical protein